MSSLKWCVCVVQLICDEILSEFEAVDFDDFLVSSFMF